MKILWITFTLFPEAYTLYSGEQVKGSGGWLFGSAEAILNYFPDVELRVVSVNAKIKEYSFIKGDKISYYLIPYGRGYDTLNHGYDAYWKMITEEYCPDVVHIHGIETTLALSYMRVCGSNKVVNSIQGLPDVISRYLLHGLDRKTIMRSITIRDIIRANTFFSVQCDNERREKYIKDSIREGRYFIGRTTWDRAHIWAVNPSAKYFFCNETLRTDFYNYRWTYEGCQPHTIFISAMKGIHLFFKAFPLIVRHYPDAKVYIAGGGNLKQTDLRSKFLMTGYENIVRRQILKNHLEKHVVFMGQLSSEEMIRSYLSANVFVNPSTCENSSNSIGEAQLLGTPVIASYVGGTPDMIPDIDCGIMYRCEEYEMLAHAVCSVFEEAHKFDNTNMRKVARERHDRKLNAERTMEIYQEIVKAAKS